MSFPALSWFQIVERSQKGGISVVGVLLDRRRQPAAGLAITIARSVALLTLHESPGPSPHLSRSTSCSTRRVALALMLSLIPVQHMDHAQHPDAAAGAHPARHGEQALQIRARRPQVGTSHAPHSKGLTHLPSSSGKPCRGISIASPVTEVVPAHQLTAATRALPCRCAGTPSGARRRSRSCQISQCRPRCALPAYYLQPLYKVHMAAVHC